jgi:hypothetical protein
MDSKLISHVFEFAVFDGVLYGRPLKGATNNRYVSFEYFQVVIQSFRNERSCASLPHIYFLYNSHGREN